MSRGLTFGGMSCLSGRSARAIAALLAAFIMAPLTLAACTGDSLKMPVPDVIIDSYLSDVKILSHGVSGEIRSALLPVGEAAGPDIKVGREATVVNGGSLRQVIDSSEPYTKVRVALEPLASIPTASATPASTQSATQSPAADGEDGDTAGAEPTAAATPLPSAATGTPSFGYYEITLLQPATAAEVVLLFHQTLPADRFELYYAAVDAEGRQGPVQTQTVRAIAVGTGDVQVSVSWNAPSDLDLRVVDPSGEEIWFQDPVAASGGELDLDSNSDCAIDNINNENITFPTAPAGTYQVKVSYWDSCGAKETKYVVTVRVVGRPVEVFEGTLTGEGDHAGRNAGAKVTEFDFSAA